VADGIPFDHQTQIDRLVRIGLVEELAVTVSRICLVALQAFWGQAVGRFE